MVKALVNIQYAEFI